MINQVAIKKSIAFWKNGMVYDYQTMLSLRESKRYSACLFFGHLVLEKALKALVMENTKDYAPRIHNLRRLAELAKISLSPDELDLLSIVNEFNMAGRYPEEKFDFYKLCGKTYTDKFLPKIKKMHKKLCLLMK